MQDLDKILTDIKAYKSGLAKLYETLHTCNELHEYVSKIIHYIRILDLDKGSIDPFAPQLEVNICSINPKFTYGTASAKSKRLFRTCQHEINSDLSSLISNIESRLKGRESGNNES